MKESKFNLSKKVDEGYLLYNSLTGALASLSEGEFTSFQGFLSDPNFKLDNRLEKDLIYGGYLVGDETDELTDLETFYNKERRKKTGLGLTLCPTLACNFRCNYCFESSQDSQIFMGKKVQRQILDLVKSKNIDHLSICWFGGEPLLGLDIIESLSKELLAYCKQKNIQYSAFMITNGYLLNEESVQILKACHVRGLQVTLDGGPQVHNKRRSLKDGQGTFRVILENVKKYASEDFFIHIRVNIDKENRQDVVGLLNYFNKKDLDYLSFDLGYVDDMNGSYDQEKCLSLEDYYNLQRDFKENLESRFSLAFPQELPGVLGSVCGADRVYSYGIDPQGNLYRCWNHFGRLEKSIGSLTEGLEEEGIYKNYMQGPFEDKACRSCKFLPICMGGCPDDYQQNGKRRCHSYKFTWEKEVEDVMRSFDRRKDL